MLTNESQRLGFDDPDTAIRKKWEEIPEWLQNELLLLGFKNKK